MRIEGGRGFDGRGKFSSCPRAPPYVFFVLLVLKFVCKPKFAPFPWLGLRDFSSDCPGVILVPPDRFGVDILASSLTYSQATIVPEGKSRESKKTYEISPPRTP